jgi:cyclohexa-1,5-dienecarbonyl-CoA hydratase
MIADLEEVITRAAEAGPLVALILSGEGPHFSFGASVEEHLPDQIGDTLAALHGLLARILDFPGPTIAAIRGQCLGGGLELALACDLILAEERAQLGQPEIKLAVFPPAASALLPARIGAGPAAELLLTGESWSGREAASRGLVTRTAADGELETALELWLEKEFLPRSPAALAQAARASRRPLRRALEEELPALERQYLEELMAEPDALEGIEAFLEKRSPQWGRGNQREQERETS